MSDLIQKVSALMTANCGYCGGSGEDQYHNPEIPCGHCNGDGFHSTPGTAKDVIRTVLEEMLKGTDKTVPGWGSLEYVKLFARDNNIELDKE